MHFEQEFDGKHRLVASAAEVQCDAVAELQLQQLNKYYDYI